MAGMLYVQLYVNSSLGVGSDSQRTPATDPSPVINSLAIDNSPVENKTAPEISKVQTKAWCLSSQDNLASFMEPMRNTTCNRRSRLDVHPANRLPASR